MKIVDSVAKAIADWQIGDLESAMIHACNAVHGTAKKACPGLGDRASFVKLLRDNYLVLAPMGMPGFDLDKTRFSVSLDGNGSHLREFDLADVVYKVHRCAHHHGDEVVKGFELIPDAAVPHGTTHFIADFQDGIVQLSDRIIFGMLGVVVFSSVNANQVISGSYFLSYDGIRLPINKWWGRAVDFLGLVHNSRSPSIEIMEFGSGQSGPAGASNLHFKIVDIDAHEG